MFFVHCRFPQRFVCFCFFRSLFFVYHLSFVPFCLSLFLSLPFPVFLFPLIVFPLFIFRSLPSGSPCNLRGNFPPFLPFSRRLDASRLASSRLQTRLKVSMEIHMEQVRNGEQTIKVKLNGNTLSVLSKVFSRKLFV